MTSCSAIALHQLTPSTPLVSIQILAINSPLYYRSLTRDHNKDRQDRKQGSSCGVRCQDPVSRGSQFAVTMIAIDYAGGNAVNWSRNPCLPVLLVSHKLDALFSQYMETWTSAPASTMQSDLINIILVGMARVTNRECLSDWNTFVLLCCWTE